MPREAPRRAAPAQIRKPERLARRLRMPAEVMSAEHQETVDPQATHPEGRYANAFRVGHNAFEFVLEFSQQFAGMDEAPGHTRVVTSPYYAKGMLETLRISVEQYEQQFGVIEDAPGG
jgi:Protein of unknown function (DUF3467)